MTPKVAHCSTLQHVQIGMVEWPGIAEHRRDTLPPAPRARTPVRDRGPELASDEVRDEVGQNPEKS